ncbi:MAG TPA: alanyl-tRNA editing protein, partial [Clostridia bacterium]|nr:alanyl-tRNA editing protein [Clostridia bacterium]
CTKLKDGYGVVLDRTYFYPEGGGQPSDLGLIDDIAVKDVYYYKDEIVHLLEAAVKLEKVSCKIDWQRRLDFMQQHLGQHILSRAFEMKYDANTIGFHIGDDYVTIDLDQKLNQDALDLVEDFSNQIVYESRPVEILSPTKEELKEMPLRKEPTVSEDIRVIRIKDFDFSPCGGTHLKTTSEVGIIKIKKSNNNNEGIRVEFVCGRWALKDYQWKNQMINDISHLLTIKTSDIKDRVEALNTEVIETKKEMNALKTEILDMKTQAIAKDYEIVDGVHVITQKLEDYGIKELRYIANNIIEKENTRVCLVGLEGNQVHLVLGKNKALDYDLKESFSDFIDRLEGNGGGSPFLCQGSGTNHDAIVEIIIEFNK